MRRQLPDLRTAFLGAFGWVGALAGAGHGLVLPVTLGAVLALVGDRARALARQWRGTRAGRGPGRVRRGGHGCRRALRTPLAQPAQPARRDAGRRGPDGRRSATIRARSRGGSARRCSSASTSARSRRTAASFRLREPVLLFARQDWLAVPLGATVRVGGHLGVASGSDVAAVLSTSSSPDIRAGPDPWWRASARVRAALRESVARLPPDRRALVPALVDGDDAALDPALADDFRTTGLTHLLAVSGTNLTLVVGLRPGRRTLVPRPRALAVRRRRRRDPRVRPPRPRRAERAPRGGDGVGRPARDGGERRRPRHARARRRHHRAAARRPRCWRRPSGSGSRSSPRPASCCWRRDGGTRWRDGCPAGWRRRSRCPPPPSSRAHLWSRPSPAR